MAYCLIFETFKLDMNTIYRTTTKVGVTFPALVFASETTFRCNVVLFFTAVFFVSNKIHFDTVLNFIMTSRYKPLHDAVRGNRKCAVKQLMNNGTDVNVPDDRGTTALHIAVETRNLDMVQYLLGLGADPNAEGKYGNTPLHVSSANGDGAVTLALLNGGSGTNVRNRYGESPLHVAVKYNSEDVVEILLNRGAYVDAQDFYGDTVLHSCVRENCREILEILLEYGVNLNTANKEEYTAFDIAVQRCEKDMIRVLIPYLLLGKNAQELASETVKSLRMKSELRQYISDCLDELTRAKTLMIQESSVTHGDLLTKSVKELEKCAGNAEIELILQQDMTLFQFPIYAGVMRRNFERGSKRRQLLQRCFTLFSSVTKSDLPLLCLEKIFGHFTDYELVNFRPRRRYDI